MNNSAIQVMKRINLGHQNSRLPRCRDEGIIIYGVRKEAYELFQQGKREELIEFYLSQTSAYTGENCTRAVATRYLNNIEYFTATGPEVTWITTSNKTIYWGTAEQSHDIIGSYNDSDPRSYLLAKKMRSPWNDRTLTGENLDLWKIHPTARKWLMQQASMAGLNSADYFFALIEGRDLSRWHGMPEMIADAQKDGWRQNSPVPEVPKDWGFVIGRMVATILKTAATADGRIVTSIKKIKNCPYSETELHVLLRKILKSQNYLCKLTGRRLHLDGQGDPWLRASADRDDSNGHYVEENIQIVSKAANFAKRNLPPEEVQAFLQAVQFPSDIAEEI